MMVPVVVEIERTNKIKRVVSGQGKSGFSGVFKVDRNSIYDGQYLVGGAARQTD